MREFLDYLFDQELAEMAAPGIRFGSEKVEEKRKVPIFIDQDDIDFLYQFPPQLWSQALSQRYGDLLYKAHQKLSEGQRISDKQNMRFNWRGEILFKGIDTGINKLYHKLTADVDDEMFSTLDTSPQAREQYTKAAEEKGLGYSGFVLKDFQKSKQHKGLGASQGYIMLTQNDASRRLADLRRAINQGWMGEPPENAAFEQVSFGGGASKEPTWVHDSRTLTQLPGQGQKYGRTQDGKRIWYGYRRDGSRIRIRSHLPVLKPAKMFSAGAVREFNQADRLHKQINRDLDSDEFEFYFKAADPTTRPQLERHLEELDHWLARPETKKMRKERRTKLRDRAQLEDTLRITKMASEAIVADGGSPSDLRDPDKLREYLGKAAEQIKQYGKQIQSEAQPYDVHDWNVHHFNPRFRNPHTGWKGFGTVNVNWQQKETVHGGLLKLGINPEEFWNDLQQYLVQAGVEGESPFVKAGPSGQRRLEPLDDNRLALGYLGLGINKYLSKKGVYGTPAWYAMTANWWDILENAAVYLRGFVGSKHFLPYARVYKKHKAGEEHPALGSAFRKMEEGAFRAGYTYAGLVFQLKSRMGKSVGGGPSLEDILQDKTVNEDLSQAAQHITQLWGRPRRTADPGLGQHGEHGRTSHDVRNILQQIESEEVTSQVEQAVDREQNVANTVAQQMGSPQEGRMAKNIVDTGMAFQIYKHIFIWSREQTGQAVNEQQAKAFAAQALQKFLRKRGIRQFSGEITPTAGAAEEIEEMPSQEGPKDADEKAQKLMALARVVQNPKTIRRLDKKSKHHDPKLRAFFDRMIEKRDLGWPLVAKVLKKLD